MKKCNCEEGKHSSPPVVEIHNNECPVLFHKVLVPAAMGDDVDNPPKNGQYRNVLLQYEANGHVYIYSSDGVVTYISDGSEGEGTTDYNELTHKPKINGVTLDGDLATEDLNIIIPKLVSELQNDAGYITKDVNDLVSYYDKTEVNTLLTAKADVSAIPAKTSDLTNDSNFAVDANYVHTDNNYTTAEKNKLAGIAAGAEVNVQSNWAQTNSSADDFIKNKPSIPAKTSDLTNDSNFVSNTSYATASTGGVVKVGSGLSITNGVLSATGGGTADSVEWDNVLNKPSFSTVATSGSYNDLSNKPTIPTVNDATLTIQKNGTTVTTFTANSAQNATADISVPTKVSDLTNDLNFVEETDLAGVAFSGAYADITGTPYIPTKTSDLTNDSDFVSDANYVHTDNNFTTALKDKLNGIATGAEVNVQSDWNTTDTSSDAFIKNKPAIPTKTSDLTNDSGFITSAAVPTKTSDLTNDSGFITNQVNNLANYYDQTAINSMFNALDVPTKTSDLTNDSGFLTSIPIASASTLGGVKIGNGINVAADGTISAAISASPEWDDIINKPTDVSYWTNDAGYITSADIPTKTSDLTNDSDFVTSADVPTKTSDLTNDSGFITNSVSNLANYYKKSETYTQGEVNSLLSAITIPTKTSDLTNDGSDGTSTYVTQSNLATQLANKQNVLTAGDHINITDSTIKAVDYVHSDDPVSTSQVTPVVTNDMIADGTITADKLASGATVKLTLSTSDIGEGTALATNTLYGVYK